MSVETKTEDILKQFGGSAADVDRELQRFRKATRVLSSKHPRLIDRYPKQWIGVYQGRVRVHGRTFTSVMRQIAEKRLPREDVIVRFIDKNQRAMIL